MAKRWITQEEARWLFEHKFSIHSIWVSPQEGYEFRLHLFGEKKVSAYRTTERGCYNAARKIWAAQHRLHQTAGRRGSKKSKLVVPAAGKA